VRKAKPKTQKQKNSKALQLGIIMAVCKEKKEKKKIQKKIQFFLSFS
jgi:hypothetical protein